MNLLKEIDEYRAYIRKNNYVYSLQKQGMESLYTFVKRTEREQTRFEDMPNLLDYFLAVWVPRTKKYLAEVEAFNIIYAVQDFYAYLEDRYEEDEEDDLPLVLKFSKEEYARVYKAKRLIGEMTGDPIISTNPTVIHLDNYRDLKEKKQRQDSMSMYEQGIFRVDEVNKEGYIGLSKLNGGRYCKVLCRPNLLYHFKEKDLIHLNLRKKIFFVYWEIDEIKAYYPAWAAQYL